MPYFPYAIAKLKGRMCNCAAQLHVHCAAPFHADFLPGAYILYI